MTALTVSGNITSGNFIGTFANGNSNVNIPTANGNINLTAGGNVTLIVTPTGANIAGYANVSGNISAANITGPHDGSGAGLSSITGANVTGTVANATYATSAGSATTATSATTAGTVTTAAQPNITSVGTLTSLTVTGNTNSGNVIVGNITASGGILAANVTANAGGFFAGSGFGLTNIPGANVTGTVANATYATSTGVGTLTSGTWNANVIGTSYIATLNQNTTGYAATVSGAAQGNITSLGTLTGLTVSGSAQISSLGVGTAAVGTSGEIVATNNIIAYYSDGRLKTVSSTIPNALDKVSKLSGVYYTTNELAESFGYTDKANQVGVIAQEVEAVLPEVVTLAPFDRENVDGEIVSKSGENYKTVYYDKLVPLLIEAIKELKAEIDMLKSNKP